MTNNTNLPPVSSTTFAFTFVGSITQLDAVIAFSDANQYYHVEEITHRGQHTRYFGLVAFDNRRITIDTLANVYPFCSWSTWRTDLLRHLRTGRLPGPADFLGMRNLELHMHVPYVPLNQVNIGETEVDIASTQPDIEIVSISDTSTIPYPLRLPPNALLTPSEMSTRAETDLTLPEQDAQWDNDDLENL